MKTSKLLPALLAVAIAGAVAPGHALAQPAPATPAASRTPDVVFVPTPQPVVDAMLKMANVKPGEMVYDLGCGDGRAVITAAKSFGARGIGVDIDPKRIEESVENAKAAGVTDRVQFKQEDLFEMQFSDADVLFLYLLPRLNVRLRPRILDELKPGTRVVSHAFSMGDWDPDQRDEVEGKTIYFWKVPAKVAGDWKVTLPGGEEATLSLTQEYQKVSGTVKTKDKSLPVSEGTLDGKTLVFAFGSGADAGKGTFEIEGRRLSGTIQRGGSGGAQNVSGQRVQ
jgi:SAM-dependent methyltransferase